MLKICLFFSNTIGSINILWGSKNLCHFLSGQDVNWKAVGHWKHAGLSPEWWLEENSERRLWKRLSQFLCILPTLSRHGDSGNPRVAAIVRRTSDPSLPNEGSLSCGRLWWLHEWLMLSETHQVHKIYSGFLRANLLLKTNKGKLSKYSLFLVSK